MSFCELCGRPSTERKKIVVDATVFNVCISCSKHGKAYTPGIVPAKKKMPASRPSAGYRISMSDEIILDPDFPGIIREARMKKGLTHEQLGMQMNEKANLLKRFETGTLKPDEVFAKKLERHLGVKLYVSANSSSSDEDK